MKAAGVSPVSRPTFSRVWKTRFRKVIIPKVRMCCIIRKRNQENTRVNQRKYSNVLVIIITPGKQVHEMWRLRRFEALFARDDGPR